MPKHVACLNISQQYMLRKDGGGNEKLGILYVYWTVYHLVALLFATDHLDTGFLSRFSCVLKANAEVVPKYPRCQYMLLM